MEPEQAATQTLTEDDDDDDDDDLHYFLLIGKLLSFHKIKIVTT
jgi:hypothetical protein